MMVRNQLMLVLKLQMVFLVSVQLCFCMKRELLRIVQLMVISGRKMLSVLCRVGKNCFIVILISCIMVVIELMKQSRVRKERLNFVRFGLSQVSVFFLSRQFSMMLFVGIVIVSMKMMVMLRLMVVLMCLEMVRNEYMFRKKVRVRFLMKIVFKVRLMQCFIVLIFWFDLFWFLDVQKLDDVVDDEECCW